MTAAQASSCKTPPVAALPASAVGWGPQDEAFFASPEFCKHRDNFDLQSVQSRMDMEVVKSAMRAIRTAGYMRMDGPPFREYIRPVPVSPEGWRQMKDPINAIPYRPDTTGGRVPLLRYFPSRFMSFRVVSPDRICVDIGFSASGKTGPMFVQTHVFERSEGGPWPWLFTGFAGPDCPPVARPAN